MEFNLLAICIAALVPIALGFVWYNPNVFGKAWMKAAEVTEEKLKSGNMAVVFGVSLVLSFLLAFFTTGLVIHEMGVYGMTEGQMDGAITQAFLEEWAGKYRSFKHGALHGAMSGVGIVFPIIAINGMFERKSWKYIFINSGYWIVCLAIMGSIIGGWV